MACAFSLCSLHVFTMVPLHFSLPGDCWTAKEWAIGADRQWTFFTAAENAQQTRDSS